MQFPRIKNLFLSLAILVLHHASYGLTVNDIIIKYRENISHKKVKTVRSSVYRKFIVNNKEYYFVEKLDRRFDGERYDGTRMAYSVPNFNDTSPPPNVESIRQFYDGELIYDGFLTNPNDYAFVGGKVVIAKPKYNPLWNQVMNNGDSILDGFIPSNFCISILELIQTEESVALSEQTNNIRGVECYLIATQGKLGTHKIWFDPTRDFEVAKLEMKKDKDQYLYAYTKSGGTDAGKLHSPDQTECTLDIVKYKNQQDAWLPIEGTLTLKSFSNGNLIEDAETRVEREAIDIKPDLLKLGAFTANFPEGTEVMLADRNDGLIHKWIGGKAVIDNGDALKIELDESLGKITKMNLEGPISKESALSSDTSTIRKRSAERGNGKSIDSIGPMDNTIYRVVGGIAIIATAFIVYWLRKTLLTK